MNAAQNKNSGFEGRDCSELDRSELDWRAFQYIAGEFTPAQAEEFEERLATEQDAREAVARAVDLAESTRSALEGAELEVAPDMSPAVASSARHWLRPVALRPVLRPIALAICGIAAAVALVVTLAGLRQPSSNNNDNQFQVAEGHGEVRELAMAWATGRTDLTGETLTGESTTIETTESSDEAFAGSSGDVEESEGIETPSWMLIAVAGLTQNGAVSVEQNEQGLE